MKKLALICLCLILILSGCQTTKPSEDLSSEPVSEEVVSETSLKDNYDYGYVNYPETYDTNTWQGAYKKFLKENYYENTDTLQFALRDFNDDETPELLIKHELEITVYTFDKKVIKIDSYDYVTGTTKLFLSDNPKYPGIFSFTVGGGMYHHGYLILKDNKLVWEELWNEDYSNVSSHLELDRDIIVELSDDKQLIAESRKVDNYKYVMMFWDYVHIDYLIS